MPGRRSVPPADLAARALAAGVLLAAPGSAGADLLREPAVLEPGFRVEVHAGCTAHLHGNAVLAPRPVSVACTPAGWGPERLVAGVHDAGAELLLVDPPAPAELFASFGDLDHVALGDIEPAPPGWPLGDLLYVVLLDGTQPDGITGFAGLTEDLQTADALSIYSPAASMGLLAPDPSGSFGHDLVYSFGGILYRRSPSGSISVFMPWTGGALQFGPGGDWGHGLYLGRTIAYGTGVTTPSPVPDRPGPWASGPLFNGDMFTACGPGQVCRLMPDGTMTLFAEGLVDPEPAFCRQSLWFFDEDSGDCLTISPIIVEPVAEFWPSRIMVHAPGNSFSITTALVDGPTGHVFDPALLGPAYISKVDYSHVDDPFIPVPSAEPGCDSATQDGLWETVESRRLHEDGSMELVFETPSDGNCETMDGNRRDLNHLLRWVFATEEVTVCYSARHPEIPGIVQGCGQVTGLNPRLHPFAEPAPIGLGARARP